MSFEEPVLKAVASRLNIDLRIRPGYTIYDRLSGRRYALSYIMDLVNGKCPFLHNNRCIIHSIYKPYICRSYPYVPKEVRYLIHEGLRIIVAKVEYGLSAKCPVIQQHKYYIDKMLTTNPFFIAKYMPNEYRAAVEAEQARNFILNLLSSLWRRGVIDLVSTNTPREIVNVYYLLQQYYPNLPYILGLNKVFSRIKEL